MGPFTAFSLARVIGEDYDDYKQHTREYLKYLKFETERTIAKIQSIRGSGVRFEVSASPPDFIKLKGYFNGFSSPDYFTCRETADIQSFYEDNVNELVSNIVTSIVRRKRFFNFCLF